MARRRWLEGRFVYRDRSFPGLDLRQMEGRFRTLAREWLAEQAQPRAVAKRQVGQAAQALAAARAAHATPRRLL